MALTNALNELLKFSADRGYKPEADIEALDISVQHVHCLLLPGYTVEDYRDTMDKLNVEYNDGYGLQQLFGIVWLKDGTWMERGEYDGSEWWEHRTRPKLPTA